MKKLTNLKYFKIKLKSEFYIFKSYLNLGQKFKEALKG